MGMSTNLPRYTVIAHTDHGDIRCCAYDPILARVLIGDAVRSRYAGAVTLEENQIKVGFSATWDDEGVAELLDLLGQPETVTETKAA